MVERLVDIIMLPLYLFVILFGLVVFYIELFYGIGYDCAKRVLK